MKKDFIEESDYVIDSQGGLLISPSLIDYFKNNYKKKEYQNNHLVYIFIDKDIPGIKFYNLNSEYNDKKYYKFFTKKKLITEAKWDYIMNNPIHTMIFKSDKGNIKIDTFIIHKEKMFKILKNIKENNQEYISITIKKNNFTKKE